MSSKSESLWAILALVWFLSAVYEHVTMKVPRSRENFTAVWAFERRVLFGFFIVLRSLFFAFPIVVHAFVHRGSKLADHRIRRPDGPRWHQVHRIFSEEGVRGRKRYGKRQKLWDVLYGKREIMHRFGEY